MHAFARPVPAAPHETFEAIAALAVVEVALRMLHIDELVGRILALVD